ncbi:MAX gene-associated protein-like [Oncorhynchus clarkii lewisi]|uniref:MAX gene-associated protein-like n=1 Tax=Oncorhynchus clarkii lewisi TaxID=490388 RepID=UPI0039B8A1C2
MQFWEDLRNKCERLEKLKSGLTRERAGDIKKISKKSGKTEKLIIRKLQDISTKQKDMAFKRKWRGPSSSVSPNKTISLRSTRQPKPKSLAPSLKLKVVATPVPHSVPQKPASQRPKTSPITPPSSKNPSPRERTRPNILSGRKIQPAPDSPPVHAGFLPPQMLSIVGGVITSEQVIAMQSARSLLPRGRVNGIEMQQSQTPGVASVNIIIPSMAEPISLTPTFNNCNRGVPNFTDVISLVKARQNQSAPGVSGGAQRRPAPVKGRGSGLEYGEVLGKQLDHAVDSVGINDADENSEEDEDNKDGDGEDESLTSVLNEIFILNQQITTDNNSSPKGPPVVSRIPHTEPGQMGTVRVPTPQTDRVLLPPKTEKVIIGDGDDERSLSPLFLRLDEDKGQEKTSKRPGLPIPQAEDLKVGFGSNLKPSETVSAPAVNGHSQQAKACTTKGQDVLQKALTPPLLLQMKVGGVAEVLESNEKPGDALTPPPLLQMRPMPRLDPR